MAEACSSNQRPGEIMHQNLPDDSVKRVVGSTENLLVHGLSKNTRAIDLKSLFTKYGKVSSLNILTDAKTPGTWYGLITMATNEEALLCIEKLNNTKLHGRIITVEKTTQEPIGTVKSSEQSIQPKSSQKESEKTAESSEGPDIEIVAVVPPRSLQVPEIINLD